MYRVRNPLSVYMSPHPNDNPQPPPLDASSSLSCSCRQSGHRTRLLLALLVLYALRLPTSHSSRGSAWVRSFLFSPLLSLDSHRLSRASTHPPVTKARTFVLWYFYFFHINLTLRYIYQIVNFANNRILRCLIIVNSKNTFTPLIFWVIINILGFKLLLYMK